MPFGTPGTHPLARRDASEEVLLGPKTEDPKKHKVEEKKYRLEKVGSGPRPWGGLPSYIYIPDIQREREKERER